MPKNFKKMASAASLLGARHLGKVVENKPASSLVVSLGKALFIKKWERCKQAAVSLSVTAYSI